MPAEWHQSYPSYEWNLGASHLEQLLETIQHVPVCEEGDNSHFRQLPLVTHAPQQMTCTGCNDLFDHLVGETE
jgi:hypothetical protein